MNIVLPGVCLEWLRSFTCSNFQESLRVKWPVGSCQCAIYFCVNVFKKLDVLKKKKKNCSALD